MSDPDPKIVYDDEVCAERGLALKHIKEDDGRCPYCHEVCYRRSRPPTGVIDPPPTASAARGKTHASSVIPPHLYEEYSVARHGGLSESDAEEIVALKHGLSPAVPEGETPQRASWTLRELNALEFMRYLVSSGRLALDMAVDDLPNLMVT